MTVRWYEYHCWESLDSGDAAAWLRSHEQVVVLAEVKPADEDVPAIYRVLFADGLTWDVFDDELVESPADFTRPDPPTPVA